MKKRFKYITIVLICSFALANSQQSQQKIEMKINEIGDAELNISMTMDAQQWQVWNASLGNNPAALKRDMKRAMPAYFLDNFKLEKDDMNRSFNLSLTAYGVCKIDKRSNWLIDTDQKDAQLTELNSHKYMLVSSPQEFGGSVQQTFIIEFPKEANAIKIDKDAYGGSIFKFKMDNSSMRLNLSRWSGIILVLAGGVLTGKKLKTNL